MIIKLYFLIGLCLTLFSAHQNRKQTRKGLEYETLSTGVIACLIMTILWPVSLVLVAYHKFAEWVTS